MNIDRKFRILAVNPCKKGKVYTENEGIFLCAKDEAVPFALQAYKAKCVELGCGEEHLESICLLIDRIDIYQGTHGAKIPDTESDCEIDRCVGGIFRE